MLIHSIKKIKKDESSDTSSVLGYFFDQLVNNAVIDWCRCSCCSANLCV